jgi:hypothetical protein
VQKFTARKFHGDFLFRNADDNGLAPSSQVKDAVEFDALLEIVPAGGTNAANYLEREFRHVLVL